MHVPMSSTRNPGGPERDSGKDTDGQSEKHNPVGQAFRKSDEAILCAGQRPDEVG